VCAGRKSSAAVQGSLVVFWLGDLRSEPIDRPIIASTNHVIVPPANSLCNK
jgi:hypothetical protein